MLYTYSRVANVDYIFILQYSQAQVPDNKGVFFYPPATIFIKYYFLFFIMVKVYNRFNREPIYLRRYIKAHKRRAVNNKRVKVKEYLQSYVSPRGKVSYIKPDNLTKRSQTMWLMDRFGHFVGRANYQGNTRAKNVSKFGYDTTTVKRDTKKYKRVFGRTSQ